MDLRHLTDDQLLQDTNFWVNKERESVLSVLFHIKETERRRVFSTLGYSSLFEYSVKCLGYSEGAAMRRIHSARLLLELPIIGKKFQSGLLSLSNVSSAANLFKKENIRSPEKKLEILGKIEGTTSRECEKVLDFYKGLNSEKLYPVYFKVNESAFSKYHQLRGVLAPKIHSDSELLDLLVTTAMKEKVETKFKRNAAPSSEVPGNTRYIPASVKREVYERSGGKCEQCGGDYRLEYDHIKPFSMHGTSTQDNLRLLCFSCNQRSRIEARL